MQSAAPRHPRRRPRAAHFVFALLAAGPAHAAAAAAPATLPSPASGILHVVLGLAVVLLVMWACAWMLKRYTGGRHAASGALRVVSAVAVGQRERVVIVEVGETWMVVGVAPGRVNALHTMARLPAAPPSGAPQPSGGGFAARFAQMLERRGNDR